MRFSVFALLFTALVFSLGCIGEKEETNTGVSVPKINESSIIEEKPEASSEEVPVYDAPLDPSKISLSCETDADCVLIKYKTGIGESEYCLNINSSYEGVHSNKCYCKTISTSYEFYNGSEEYKPIKECHHI